MGVLGVALYVEDKHLPDRSLPVALDRSPCSKPRSKPIRVLFFCRTFAEIEAAQRDQKIGLILTMEGAEPLGSDLHLISIFYRLGLRAISLTHARENAAAAGEFSPPAVRRPGA